MRLLMSIYTVSPVFNEISIPNTCIFFFSEILQMLILLSASWCFKKLKLLWKLNVLIRFKAGWPGSTNFPQKNSVPIFWSGQYTCIVLIFWKNILLLTVADKNRYKMGVRRQGNCITVHLKAKNLDQPVVSLLLRISQCTKVCVQE